MVCFQIGDDMRKLAILFVAAFLGVVSPAAAQSCAPQTTGSTTAQLASLRACIAQIVAKNATQDAAIAPLRSEAAAIATLTGQVNTLTTRVNAIANGSAQVTALSGQISTLTTRVDTLTSWRAGVDAALADLTARMEDVEAGQGGQASLEPGVYNGAPLVQAGLTGIAYYDYEEPFLDQMRSQSLATCDKPSGGGAATPAEMLADGVFDTATGDFVSIGSFAQCTAAIFGFRAVNKPLTSTESWVVDWQGSGTVQVVWCASTKTLSGNRIVVVRPVGASDYCGVLVTATGAGFGGLRVFRAEHETRLAAGEMFNPDFLTYTKRYPWLRPMDWSNTNLACANRVSQLRADTARVVINGDSDFRYCGTALGGDGVPLRLLFRLAREANSALWINAPGFLGAPDDIAATWQLDRGAGWEARALEFRSKGQANATTTIASSEWDAWADKVVAAMVAENYPLSRPIYIEPTNESWNFVEITQWHWGIGAAVGPAGSTTSYGYGWTAARLAEALDGALARAGRSGQAWKLVLARQAANVSTSTIALSAYRQYFVAKAVDPTPWLAKAGLSVAAYFYGFDTSGNPWGATDSAALTTAVANAAQTPAVFAQAVADFLVDSPASAFGSLNWTMARLAEHKAAADAAGVVFLGAYEGEDHGLFPSGLANNAAVINAVENYRFGVQGARVRTALLQRFFAAYPNALYADFTGPSQGDPQGDAVDDTRIVWPWQDGQYNTPNARDLAIRPYLRVVQ